MCFSLKLRQTSTLLENEKLTPEFLEVLDVGLVSGEYLIWSLVQDLAEIKMIVAWQAVLMASTQSCMHT